MTSADINDAGASSTFTDYVTTGYDAALTDISLTYVSTNAWAVAGITVKCGDSSYSADITSNSISASTSYTVSGTTDGSAIWMDLFDGTDSANTWYAKLPLDKFTAAN